MHPAAHLEPVLDFAANMSDGEVRAAAEPGPEDFAGEKIQSLTKFRFRKNMSETRLALFKRRGNQNQIFSTWCIVVENYFDKVVFINLFLHSSERILVQKQNIGSDTTME